MEMRAEPAGTRAKNISNWRSTMSYLISGATSLIRYTAVTVVYMIVANSRYL